MECGVCRIERKNTGEREKHNMYMGGEYKSPNPLFKKS